MTESSSSPVLKQRGNSAGSELATPSETNQRSNSPETNLSGSLGADHHSTDENATPRSSPFLQQRSIPLASNHPEEEPNREHGTLVVAEVAPRLPPVIRVSDVDHPALDPTLDGVQDQNPETPRHRRQALSNDGEEDESIDQLIAKLEALDGEEIPVKGQKEDGRPKEVPDHWMNTDHAQGLSTTQVLVRRKTCGFNEMKSEKKKNEFLKFGGYFIGPIQCVIEAAAILAAMLGSWIDLGVLGGLLLLNAVISVWQEWSAKSVVDALKATLETKAVVLRDGRFQELDIREIVPGDLVKVEEGTVIPADGLIVTENVHLQVDQSAMTGESLPCPKQQGDICYASSLIKRGDALIIVNAIGDDTFMGRMASLVSNANADQGQFTRVTNGVGGALLVTVIGVLIAIWLTGFYRSKIISDMMRQTLAITIIGIPVGLPAVVTTTMAVGAAFLAKKQAIVQKLTAIESLAGVQILCSDKYVPILTVILWNAKTGRRTGTLTKNKLTMGEPHTVGDVKPDQLVLIACLAASRKATGMEPIDKAFLRCLRRYPEAKQTIDLCNVIDFTPFDPVSKKVTAVCDIPEGGWMVRTICVKGAPVTVLNWVASQGQIPAHLQQEYEEKVEEFASRGFRALGIAAKRGDNPWQLLGIMPCSDPPRHDTAETIDEAKILGLKIKMLTGDAVGIARETARQLKLGTKIYNADKLGVAGQGIMPASEMSAYIEAADGFAEVLPEHKHSVVAILQQRGYLVAMTGDGVNDAPSLKRANVGIAVEGASEAARSAADIIFVAPGLSAITDAIKTSRQIFHRMRAYIIYRIALSLHLEIFFGLWIIFLDNVLTIELIVFIAIFADIATLTIAYDKAPYSRIPDRWNLPNIWGTAILLGIVLAAGTWICFSTMIIWGPNGGIVQDHGNQDAVLFLEIVLTENWLILITRTNGVFLSSPYPSWQLAGAILLVDILATCFCVFGFFVNERTNGITVFRIWIFSSGIFLVMAGLYTCLQDNVRFNNLMHGRFRRRRRHYNSWQMQNFDEQLKHATIPHPTQRPQPLQRNLSQADSIAEAGEVGSGLAVPAAVTEDPGPPRRSRRFDDIRESETRSRVSSGGHAPSLTEKFAGVWDRFGSTSGLM